MKIYCRSLSNRDIFKEIDRRGALLKEYDAQYNEFNEAKSEYEENFRKSSAQVSKLVADKLGIDPKFIKIHKGFYSTKVEIDITDIPELVNMFPELPKAPVRPTFDTDEDKQLNREAITQFYNQHLWFKINYINRARGTRSEESMYIKILSISPTGKECKVNWMASWDFEGVLEGRPYYVVVRTKTLTTGNIEIVSPIVTYTSEEVEEILKEN